MMKLKQINQNTIIIAAICLLMLSAVLIYFYGGDSPSVSKNTNASLNIKPGPTGVSCISNNDCQGQCGDNDCLVESCTKRGNVNKGECTCLGICDF